MLTNQVHPCRCGHEKTDHQTRIGQRGNYTPCCIQGCKCDGFRKASKTSVQSPDPSLVALRTAAADWSNGLLGPVLGSSDRSFAALDRRLQRAAIKFAEAR